MFNLDNVPIADLVSLCRHFDLYLLALALLSVASLACGVLGDVNASRHRPAGHGGRRQGARPRRLIAVACCGFTVLAAGLAITRVATSARVDPTRYTELKGYVARNHGSAGIDRLRHTLASRGFLRYADIVALRRSCGPLHSEAVALFDRH